MPGLTRQDLTILRHYADNGNRELYWNYLAQKEGADGYGTLALGVVRNDSMPGAVANTFADNRARSDGRILSERDWEGFGEDLVRRDLALRSDYVERNRPDLALNLPVRDVQAVHDDAFRNARIDPNAWTPRQLLEAARRQGGERAAEQVWDNMLDGSALGLRRSGITLSDIARYDDAQLPALSYTGSILAASALASGDRARTDPNVIGARDYYAVYDRRSGGWSSVANGGGFGGPVIREITDARELRELNDARAVRLESQRQRSDFHPDDPNQGRPIARSPFTLADAGGIADDNVRLAATGQAPGAASEHPLLQQANAAVARSGAEFSGTPNGSKIAIAGASLAAHNGFERIDDIVFNSATDRLAAGERFFVLQGERGSPEHLRESMPTREALALTPENMQQQVAQLDAVQTRARSQAEVRQEEELQRRQPAGPQLA